MSPFERRRPVELKEAGKIAANHSITRNVGRSDAINLRCRQEWMSYDSTQYKKRTSPRQPLTPRGTPTPPTNRMELEDKGADCYHLKRP
ncbi:hypothetical protein TNCV_2079251 [Trichonephila clavipes]|nr:hypothetical protein TNCV_2079251 [Trichonephila clavipes]